MSPLMAGTVLTPSDYIGAFITISLLIVLAMTQYPREWQNTGGFLLTLIIGIPALLLVAGILQHPILMAGSMLAFGAYAANR